MSVVVFFRYTDGPAIVDFYQSDAGECLADFLNTCFKFVFKPSIFLPLLNVKGRLEILFFPLFDDQEAFVPRIRE